MRSPESGTSHFRMSFELPDSAFKCSDEHQNCEALSWSVFLKDCEFSDFCPFGLSPVFVGTLLEAVGAQQRKRKCKLRVCEPLRSFLFLAALYTFIFKLRGHEIWRWWAWDDFCMSLLWMRFGFQVRDVLALKLHISFSKQYFIKCFGSWKNFGGVVEDPSDKTLC